MTLWRTRPVDEEPTITLENWAIIETPGENPTRHFVGYNPRNAEGRVSNIIVSFDPATMVGKTQTGRTYHLVGASRWQSDANYVLQAWCRMHQIDRDALRILQPSDFEKPEPTP